MKKMLKKINYNYLFCLLISFIALLITSKCSFLYRLNDWVDANAFFTMGKGIMNGLVPYKDLFEQKGPIIYLVYGLGYLISNKTFLGVFILEVISFSIFLYYSRKIIILFIKEKYTYIILPILTSLIVTSRAFVHGGSCEEFTLPLLIISLYYFIRHFKEKELSFKDIFIIGFISGIILITKYTMMGLSFGVALFIVLDYIIKKKYKSCFKFILIFLLGFIIPLIILLIYLLSTNSLNDFIDCYFSINLNAYSVTDISLINRFFNIIKTILKQLILNGIAISILFMFIPFIFIKSKENTYFKISIVGIIIFTFIFIFYGLKAYRYYVLPTFIFLLIPLIFIFKYLDSKNIKLFDKKITYIIIIVLSLISNYMFANYRDRILLPKSRYFQFKFADYINKYENPTLLNAGFLDAGVYTTSGIVPNIRYFELQNLSYDRYPDNLDSINKYIEDKSVMFVLYYTRDSKKKVLKKHGTLVKNYDLVLESRHDFENFNINAFLFKVK